MLSETPLEQRDVGLGHCDMSLCWSKALKEPQRVSGQGLAAIISNLQFEQAAVPDDRNTAHDSNTVHWQLLLLCQT